MRSVASPTDAACQAVEARALTLRLQPSILYTVDLCSIPSQPFGRETFACRQDAERFIEEMRMEEPERARSLRIAERRLDAGGLT